ncbi:glycine--tRNA ligase subunit beta [Hyphococcus sp. DH-69]|uniref:glycine--tRNA ligase subunit beta n=1 Tax=Hyphococcus formosus TaxID=3143534 RepID=UPI00398B5F26
MPELLLEIFSEEIPARMQPRAAADLERAVNKALIDAGYLPEGVKAFSGPRRLTLVATGLPARQPDRREEKKGPRVGAPDRAVEGFLKAAGLSSLDECEQREDKKGAYWVAVIDQKGRETAGFIADLIPEIVRGFSWPKSMRWGDGELRWVRPIHSILCVFDGEVVPFEIDGIAAGDKSEGHRFMGNGAITARSFEAYASALRDGKVILDAEERKEIIARDAETLCKAQGLELVEDPGLLAEVTGLAEWPVVMMGTFDEKFLALPDEVLTASMRGHQKYFSVSNPKTGRLANKFVYVANLETPDGGAAMRTGYERVLTARLSDGWYLYNQDLGTKLADRIDDLDKVTFFEGLGSVGDKARRIASLAREIAPMVGADPDMAERAAMLAKADLVTGMVYEFPELQGVMGRYYAIEQGESADIADAIRDHYKPAGQEDDVPTNPVSVAVALADKIDTLTAFWAIDQKPTGSKDPFALRRAALGVIQLIEENKVRAALTQLIESAFSIFAAEWESQGGVWVPVSERDYPREIKGSPPVRYRYFTCAPVDKNKLLRDGNYIAFSHDPAILKVKENDIFEPHKYNETLARSVEDINLSLTRFLNDRLKVYLKDKGHKHDAIDAVLISADGALADDFVLVASKLSALEAFLKTDDGANLAAAYKRAANILKAEEKKDKKPADPNGVDESRLAEAEEKALFGALKDAEAKTEKAVAAEDFEAAMTALSGLRGPLDAFFEKVTVNADDANLRSNRLSLLARFRTATASLADFSKLEG